MKFALFFLVILSLTACGAEPVVLVGGKPAKRFTVSGDMVGISTSIFQASAERAAGKQGNVDATEMSNAFVLSYSCGRQIVVLRSAKVFVFQPTEVYEGAVDAILAAREKPSGFSLRVNTIALDPKVYSDFLKNVNLLESVSR